MEEVILDDVDICRICLEDNPPFVSPCECTGTAGKVHTECLTTWRNQFPVGAKQREICGICNARYTTTTTISMRSCWLLFLILSLFVPIVFGLGSLPMSPYPLEIGAFLMIAGPLLQGLVVAYRHDESIAYGQVSVIMVVYLLGFVFCYAVDGDSIVAFVYLAYLLGAIMGCSVTSTRRVDDG